MATPRNRFGSVLRALAVLSFGTSPLSAAVQPSDLGIELQPIATGLVSPNLVTNAGDGSGRLFILDQVGKILIVQNGQVLPTPFLDISSLLPTLNTAFDERGLLGLAFHPNYAANGRFFVRYSSPRTGVTGEPCFGTSRGCHEEILAEFHVSAGNPNVADPTPTILFRVNKPQFNHNSGDVVFGPDGFLYFTFGDGGGANDGLADTPPSHGPGGNAQNLGVALGKIHRIDINGAAPYTIPPTNPFIAVAGARPEIFAYGLRNPYRFSFDNGPGGDNRLWLADVGQGLTEEVNIGQIGANYGWPIREGDHCFDPLANTTYPPESFCSAQSGGLTPPVSFYQHVENGSIVGISIIGGFVYRGSQFPALVGKYTFGDYSTAFAQPAGHLFYLDSSSPAQIKRFRVGRKHRELAMYVKGMGRGQDGEIYVCASTIGGPTGTGGAVYRIIPAPCPADLDNGAGGGTPDQAVNISDLLYFLAQFESGAPAADLDNGTSSGTPDQAVTIDDLLYMLVHFEAGC